MLWSFFKDHLKRTLSGHLNFAFVHFGGVTKSDPTLTVLDQSKENQSGIS